jgi:hypothetical protein
VSVNADMRTFEILLAREIGADHAAATRAFIERTYDGLVSDWCEVCRSEVLRTDPPCQHTDAEERAADLLWRARTYGRQP